MTKQSTGYLYRRGNVWWMDVVIAGRRWNRSLRTKEKREARRLARIFVLNPPEHPAQPDADCMWKLYDEGNPHGGKWRRIECLRWRKFADHSGGDVAYESMISFLNSLQGMSSKTVREYAATIRQVVRFSTGEDWPMPRVKGGHHERRALTNDECDRLLACAKGETRTLIMMGLWTGARLGDLCLLKWASVDIDSNVIRFAQSKTGGKVDCPISEVLRSCLEPLKREGEYICPRMAELYARGNQHAWRALKPVFEEAGVLEHAASDGRKRKTCHTGFHALRHTFATRLSRAGVHPDVIRALTGHASERMRLNYTHMSSERLSEAISVTEQAQLSGVEAIRNASLDQA